MVQPKTEIRFVVDKSALEYKAIAEEVPSTFAIKADEGAKTIGRADDRDIQLNPGTVSRKHAVVEATGENWCVRDLKSRHGTFVNGGRVSSTEPISLSHGDSVQFGNVVYRIRIGRELDSEVDESIWKTDSRTPGLSSVHSIDFGGSATVIADSELRGLAQQRLDVLLQSTASISEAANVEALAATLTQAVAKGVGAPRALLLRPLSDEAELEVIGEYASDDRAGAPLQISRSLVGLARQGKLARLNLDESTSQPGTQSILSLKIHTAICAPLLIDDEVEAVLYLDARDHENRIQKDAAEFCEAIAKVGSMALANLKRIELAARERMLRAELEAARIAQEQIMPPPRGKVGYVQYELQAVPGTIVAGDLFDVIPIDAQRTLVVLGDVMGKGAAAGLMMATVQTLMRATAHQQIDLPKAVAHTNSYFHDRFEGHGFVTLWLGLIDGEKELMQYVDAGHGHWCLVSADGQPRYIKSEGGPPVGLIPEAEYVSHEMKLSCHERVVVFSDGLVEQANSDEEYFGSERVLEILSQTNGPQSDVQKLTDAVHSFRGEIPLADDLTIASVKISKDTSGQV